MGKSKDTWVAGKAIIHNDVNYETNPWSSSGSDYVCYLAVHGAIWNPEPPKWWKQGRKQYLGKKYE